MSVVLKQNQRDELLDGPGELFKKIRNHISTPQGRGQVFERLIKAFLEDDPLFKERFKQVWLWSEWPVVRADMISDYQVIRGDHNE